MDINWLLFAVSHKAILYNNKKTGAEEIYNKYSLNILIGWELLAFNTSEEVFNKAKEQFDYKENPHYLDATFTIRFNKWSFDAPEPEVVDVVS